MNLKVSCHPASLLSMFSMAAGVTVKCLAMLSFLFGCWECDLKAHMGGYFFPVGGTVWGGWNLGPG